ncbi:MAG: hypothetical protein U0T72_09020 [Chitinophagales bacterium]
MGVNTVNGPALLSASTNSAAFTATSVVWSCCSGYLYNIGIRASSFTPDCPTDGAEDVSLVAEVLSEELSERVASVKNSPAATKKLIANFFMLFDFGCKMLRFCGCFNDIEQPGLYDFHQ